MYMYICMYIYLCIYIYSIYLYVNRYIYIYAFTLPLGSMNVEYDCAYFQLYWEWA